MRRILIVSAYYSPHMGGVERYTENLANKLAELGNEITIVTSSDSKRNSETINNKKVTLIELPSISIMNDRFPIIKPILSTFRAFRQITELPIDEIIINTRYYPICLLASRVAIKKRIKPILIDHSSGYLTRNDTPMNRIIRLYEILSTKLISKSNPATYAVSNRSLSWIKSLGFPIQSVIPNSIDVNSYRSIASERDWNTEFNVRAGAFVIAYAGRLIEEKGVLKAIKAVNSLPNNIHAQLMIAGSGPLDEIVFNAQNERIHFVGRLNESDMSSLLHYVDCFLMPSEYPEGMPTVLLEAAAQKCAIIVSDCAGADDIIPEKNFGTILSDCSIESIKKALLNYIRNPNMVMEHSNNVYDFVSSHFSWDQTAKHLFNEMLEKSSGSSK